MERRFPVKEPAAATPYPRDGTVRIAPTVAVGAFS